MSRMSCLIIDNSRTRVWMFTFVHTSSHSHLAKSLDEYPRQECKPGIWLSTYLRQNCEFVSKDKVLRLFIDKLGTNLMFCNYPLTKITSLWSLTMSEKLETCSAIFRSVKLVWEESLFFKLFKNIRMSSVVRLKILK